VVRLLSRSVDKIGSFASSPRDLSPPHPASHEPLPCSPARWTPSRHPSRAITGPSPTESSRSRSF